MPTVQIVRDDEPGSPREWDNMGTMIGFHRKYNLGDKHDYKSEDYDNWNELQLAIEKDFPGGEILPLYLYDHSGITMNTTGFSCQWDSGRVGFIVASGQDIRDNFGVKRLSKELRQRALEILRNEVETFSQYLEGDVYGVIIRDNDGNETFSCYGFYGSDPFTNGMSEHVPEELHEALRNAANRV